MVQRLVQLWSGAWLSPAMEASRDLAALSVPLVGELVAVDDPWEPYRLLDPARQPVEGAHAFLRDLQGAGRSAAAARSYGMDMLRWFRPVNCTMSRS